MRGDRTYSDGLGKPSKIADRSSLPTSGYASPIDIFETAEMARGRMRLALQSLRTNCQITRDLASRVAETRAQLAAILTHRHADHARG